MEGFYLEVSIVMFYLDKLWLSCVYALMSSQVDHFIMSSSCIQHLLG